MAERHTLIVNRIDSRCDCGANVLEWETATHCPNGYKYTHISSDYVGFEQQLVEARPDLEPDLGPWLTMPPPEEPYRWRCVEGCGCDLEKWGVADG